MHQPEMRACARCGAPIGECMGFVNAADFLRLLEGRLGDDPVRELCGRCEIAVDADLCEALAAED